MEKGQETTPTRQAISTTETVSLSKQEYDQLITSLQTLQTDYKLLKFQYSKLQRMIYGAKSERFVSAQIPGQLSLFDSVKEEEKPEAKKETVTYERETGKSKKAEGHGRLPLSPNLPREEHTIEPKEDITGARKIGEEINETLEYVPGKLYVKKIIRPKYLLQDQQTIVIGELPSQPIPKSNAGAGLLAQMHVAKYVDHTPFYRQIQQLKREGVIVAPSTMNDWSEKTCELLDILYNRIKEKILQSDYLMMDESPIQVLTEDKPKATHQGYMWVNVAPMEKLVYFNYRQTRSGQYPIAFLKDYHGALQTDGYAGYNVFESDPNVTLLGCFCHARRKFDEARKNDKEKAEFALTRIQQLYNIERKARDQELSWEERKKLREKEAIPVLAQIEKWLKEQRNMAPKSAIGIAVNYTGRMWPRLVRYVEDGRYSIDNNPIENKIRPLALGRKNYLFAGSQRGAHRAAMMYSFFGTCKMNEVNPFLWLHDVLSRIQEHKANRIDELLPQNWKPLDVLVSDPIK